MLLNMWNQKNVEGNVLLKVILCDFRVILCHEIFF